jgi:hypothetical protein
MDLKGIDSEQVGVPILLNAFTHTIVYSPKGDWSVTQYYFGLPEERSLSATPQNFM